MDDANNKVIMTAGEMSKSPIDDYLSEEAIMLRKLKEHVKMEYYKEHSVLMIHRKAYDYLLLHMGRETTKKKQQEKERMAKIVFLFANFTAPNQRTVSFLEHDLAIMFGVSERTIQNDIRKGKNWLFNVLSGDNINSYWKNQKGNEKKKVKEEIKPFYLPNKYELLMHNLFKGVDVIEKFTGKDSWLKNKIEYKNLFCNNYFKFIYSKHIEHTEAKQQHTAYIERNEIPQHIDNKINRQKKNKDGKQKEKPDIDEQNIQTFVLFEHFRNPIYEPGFDTDNTPYPVNWCLHPDEKARFIHGRWYLGVIHGTRRGKDRKDYLDGIGLTHEIDMHNAMPYFMIALLPDTVSKDDKKKYCELVKSGKLYEEAVGMFTIYQGESSSFAAEALKDIVIAPSRDYIKKGFQRHRNRKGKRKKGVGEIDYFFQEKFPTIHDWLWNNKEIMQKRLSWIETDFVSYVGEKYSTENIKFEWLHDGVYVSEKDYLRAKEIWDSVRDEFEAVFAK